MATRTKPLIASAALTTAAAVVVATPAVAPSASLPIPPALASAQVQLATFADLLSITPEDISNTYFGGWGFKLKPFDETDPDPDWAADFLSPFARCNESCSVTGPSGIAYMALDALINGNGQGIGTAKGVLENPDEPYQPDPDKPNYNPYVIKPWPTSAVNYYFEGGPGPGTVYLAIQPFVVPTSPLYDPAIASAIVLASNGLDSLTNVYIGALKTIAVLAREVPLVGPYVYGAIQSYLGPNTDDEDWASFGYEAGLSGILRYAIDVVLTGGNPYPPYGPTVEAAADPAASTLVSAAAVAETAADAADAADAEAVETAPSVEGDAGGSADAEAEATAAEADPDAGADATLAEVAEAQTAEAEVSEVAEVQVEVEPAVAEAAADAEDAAPESSEAVESATDVDVDITSADVNSSAKEASAGTSDEATADADD